MNSFFLEKKMKQVRDYQSCEYIGQKMFPFLFCTEYIWADFLFVCSLLLKPRPSVSQAITII